MVGKDRMIWFSSVGVGCYGGLGCDRMRGDLVGWRRMGCYCSIGVDGYVGIKYDGVGRNTKRYICDKVEPDRMEWDEIGWDGIL